MRGCQCVSYLGLKGSLQRAEGPSGRNDRGQARHGRWVGVEELVEKRRRRRNVFSVIPDSGFNRQRLRGNRNFTVMTVVGVYILKWKLQTILNFKFNSC